MVRIEVDKTQNPVGEGSHRLQHVIVQSAEFAGRRMSVDLRAQVKLVRDQAGAVG
jgi:hypothetical protein